LSHNTPSDESILSEDNAIHDDNSNTTAADQAEAEAEAEIKKTTGNQVNSRNADANSTDSSAEAVNNYDVINYVGPISRNGYIKLTQIIENKIQKDTKSDSLVLILTTHGGDPDAGYRIGRSINHYYEDTTILIPDICKSSGTLVAIAAHDLIIGDLGELGPLDIQFRKADEMGEQASTLNIFKTVNELQNATLDSFRHFVTDIRYGSGIGTKLSSDIAANLTKALISPIAEQIDPIKLGEHNRALQIAKEYATRLNQLSDNLLSGESLDRLVSEYPCHSFVIDRKEAKSLFKRVRATSNEFEEVLYRFSRLYLSKGTFNKAYLENDADVVDFQDVIKAITPDKSDVPEQLATLHSLPEIARL